MLAKVWSNLAQILRDKLRSLKSWWQVNYRSHLSLKVHIDDKRSEVFSQFNRKTKAELAV